MKHPVATPHLSIPESQVAESDVLTVHQLVLDGYECDVDPCDDLMRVWDLLDTLPDELGLAKASVPYAIPYYRGKNPEECGITGMVYSALGHITIHTFSKKRTLFLDITSPHTFNAELAYERVASEFAVRQCEYITPARRGIEGRLAPVEDRCFGPHLTIDIAEYDAPKFGMKELFDALSELPADVNMTRIMTPYVIRYEMEEGEPALSGMVLIAESHISFHLLPELRKGYVDLFSCKPFDVEKTLTLVRKQAGIIRDSVNMTSRGLLFAH